LQEATNTIEQAGVRSRAIERQLKKVQELPSSDIISTITSAIESEADTTDINNITGNQ